MSPEYGATCGFFPVDDETLALPALHRPRRRSRSRSSRRTARRTSSGTTRRAARVLRRSSSSTSATSSRRSPGPRRPQDRVPLARAKEIVHRLARQLRRRRTRTGRTTRRSPTRSRRATRRPATASPTASRLPVAHRDRRTTSATSRSSGEDYALEHGSVVIAAITSCTNTSNPSVMIAAGLAREEGGRARPRQRKPWVKTSLAPGSKVVTEYYRRRRPRRRTSTSSASTSSATAARRASATPARCRDAISAAITEGDLVVAAVLSGNRNFEARIHGEVNANYLASPPLVVAYALAGRMDIDLETEPLGQGTDGEDVFLRDLWPTPRRDRRRRSRESVHGEDVRRRLRRRLRRRRRAGARSTRPRASSSRGPTTRRTSGTRRTSTGMPREPAARSTTSRARAASRCSATRSRPTTSRPPARSGPTRPPASTSSSTASSAKQFNSYGARRGNHEVMVRGTFANIRLTQPARPRQRGHVDGAPPRRRGDDDLRRRRALPRARACRTIVHRRQGVRLRLVARLGGEGHEPARRARGDRRTRTSGSTARTS